MDKHSGSINKGSSIKIAWRSGVPLYVFVVKPYLIGLMEDAIEIKCLFNPNRVMQVIKDSEFNGCFASVKQGVVENGCLTKLDSLVIYSQGNEDEGRVNRLTEFMQINGKLQVINLIEHELYSTAMKICEFLINKNYENLEEKERDNFQKSRAFYCFFVKRDYKLSISLLKKVKAPTEEVILLFTDLFPRYAIDQMIERFEIKIKNIPYLKDQLVIYSPAMHSLCLTTGRKRTLSHVERSAKNIRYKPQKPLLIAERDEKCICTTGKLKGKNKVTALQTFLLYFLE